MGISENEEGFLKIGMLGGTFDPIHLGHLRAAEETGQALGLDKVYLIPSSSPPHKTKAPVTAFKHRLAMARLAAEESNLLEVHDLEGKRPGFSYSIETLKAFHRMFRSQPELYFILGMDAFMEIHTWKDYLGLFKYAHFVLIERAGSPLNKFESFMGSLGVKLEKARAPHVYRVSSGKTLILMKPTLLDISSTKIREMVSQGKSIRFLVAEPVRTYIMKEGLYKDDDIN